MSFKVDIIKFSNYTIVMYSNLRSLREQNNYSQQSIASFLNVSRQMYIKYEQGEVEPPVKVIMQLAKFYRVPVEYILENRIGDVQDPFRTKQEIEYKQSETEEKIADSGVINGNPSYLQAVMSLLPKLIYTEQLTVLSKLCEMVKVKNEEMEVPNKKMQAYKKLLALNEELHLNSEGRTWTREELYERD